MITRATIDDLDEMSVLWSLMVKEINPGTKLNPDWWVELQKDIIELNHCRAYIAKINNLIVGYILGMLLPDAMSGQIVAFGQEFYIMPEFRDSSMASGLYSRLVKDGKKNGAEVIEMICFKDQLQMWEAKGYEVCKYHIRRAL